MDSNNDNKKMKKESFIILVGAIIAGVAITVPFLIMYITKHNFKLSSFDELGVVGDFFGGTTVGLLSLSSIIFVTAAIIMQKEELELQRIEVRKTREEYEITNRTMKRQQFETTFFNMINLHHNILNEIKIDNSKGRDAIQQMYGDLEYYYSNTVYANYSEDLKREALMGDKLLLDDLVEKVFIDYNLSLYMDEFSQHFFPMFDENGNIDTSESDEFHDSLENGTNEEWNRRKKEHLKFFEENIKGKPRMYETELEKLNFNLAVNRISNEYVDKYKENFMRKPLKELKIITYEEIYKDKENSIGHYYRNLYRLVKLIQSETFDTNKEVNENEKRKYRGILRAQLSSFELLMIFYNVVYSKKGEKFKEILLNTNFFDDHLVTDNFIWENDIEELAKLDLPN
ncbi:hypothetical protein LAV79_22820 [Peribacillus butanolivorans]|uniref:putative phage abortive infection protein n=1 Tax=Peribacillus butanolivorans TaxID=421767 RepID=UPI0030C93ECB